MAHPGLRFWDWFLRGTGGRPGWRNLVGRATPVQLALSVAFGAVIKKAPQDLAASVAIPVASIAVALAFAWGAASLSLLTTRQVREMGNRSRGGLPEYANYFQLAILVVLISLAAWGVAAAGPYGASAHARGINAACSGALVFLSALAFSECWGVVDFSRSLFLAASSILDVEDAAGGEVKPLPPTDTATDPVAKEPQSRTRIKPRR